MRGTSKFDDYTAELIVGRSNKEYPEIYHWAEKA